MTPTGSSTAIGDVWVVENVPSGATVAEVRNRLHATLGPRVTHVGSGELIILSNLHVTLNPLSALDGNDGTIAAPIVVMVPAPSRATPIASPTGE